MFNSAIGVALDSETPPGQPQIMLGSSRDYSKPDYLPVKSADCIVIGLGTSSQPFLSGDHKRIYSDLAFNLERVVIDRACELANVNQVVISQVGGTAILPSGKVVNSAPISGSHVIALETPYLLFLKRQGDSGTLQVLQAWDLSKPQPVALDANGTPIPPQRLGVIAGLQPVSTDDLIRMIMASGTQKVAK